MKKLIMNNLQTWVLCTIYLITHWISSVIPDTELEFFLFTYPEYTQYCLYVIEYLWYSKWRWRH